MHQTTETYKNRHGGLFVKRLYRSLRMYWRTIGLFATIGVYKDWRNGHVREHSVELPDWKHPVTLRLPSSDIWVIKQILRRKEYQFDTASELATVIDAGANIGLAAIWFTHRFPGVRVIAIEAERNNFELLSKNVAPYPNITPVHAALWDKTGTIEVRDVGVGNWGFMTGDANAEAAMDGHAVSEVEAVTVDTLMDRFNLDYVDLLKMDIEGAELEVFQSSAAWLDRVGSLIVELHDWMKPGCTDSFKQGSQGFDSEWIQGENNYLTRNGVLIPPSKS